MFEEFQVRSVVLFRLSPWANTSLLLANHSASSLRWCFFYLLCGLSFPCGDLERSLTRHCGSTAAYSSIGINRYMYRCSLSRSGSLSSSGATTVFIRCCKRLLDNPMAFVAIVMLVHKVLLDHAIWTVAVVSHPVVTNHHHRHSIGIGFS